MKRNNSYLLYEAYRYGDIVTCLLLSLIFSVPKASAQDSNVLVGLGAPAYSVRIKANFSGTGGWARRYTIVNQNHTQKFFDIGVLGSIADGITQTQYG